MARPSNRDRLLDSFEDLVITSGIGTATLDAVAQRAGISKGGLLYHFPSKDSLLKGFADRLLERVGEVSAAAPREPADVVRWYLTYEVNGAEEERIFSSFLVAIHTADSGIRHVVQEALDRFAEPLRILEPALGELVRLVGDGLYMNAVLGITRPTDSLHPGIVEELARRAAT